MIEVQNLTKDYGNGKGVFNLSLTINQGEVFGFLGPNGAGKTTTIRNLMGFIKPTNGKCTIQGIDCTLKREDVMQKVGYIPGEIAFFDSLRGDQFIQFMAEMRKLKDLSYCHEILEMFDLNPKMKIKRMSKGMKQKLGIALAFMHNPEVLILDEPTSGLDPLMQRIFNELIMKEKEKGKTILMSSHSFEEIEKTCSRVGFIKDGKLAAIELMEHVKHGKKNSYTIYFSKTEEVEKFKSTTEFEILEITGNQIRISLSGKVNGLIQQLAQYDIVDIQSEKGSLEELFMPYYGG
jgi:ABC-2 type transport system ATP-binding protein